MVFTYISLRSGSLTPKPLCYMGLDKHENEVLIRTGVPTDVWFHVDSLSSAHVYLRLPARTPALTLEDIPEETLEDMCQLVKNNSIAGCKLNNTNIVYCFHSNLKKELMGMDVGTVGFNDRKQCRFRKAIKDKAIIKRMESSKKLVEWDYDAVKIKWVEEERARMKAVNKAKYLPQPEEGDAAAAAADATADATALGGDGLVMYDALDGEDMEPEERARERLKAKNENGSGIDAALDSLETISFAKISVLEVERSASSAGSICKPEWVVDEAARRSEAGRRKWLRQRGYGISEIQECSEDLHSLFFSPLADTAATHSKGENCADLREEEIEVLKAIFGDEPFCSSTFDFELPVEGFEAPGAFDSNDDDLLTVGVYAEATAYPYGPPVLTVHGGGLPERALREITKYVAAHLVNDFEERAGDATPVIFELVALIQEQAEVWVEAWLDEARKKGMEEAEKKRIEVEKEAEVIREKLMAATEQNRKEKEAVKAEKKERANALNVSQKDLIDDLFN